MNLRLLSFAVFALAGYLAFGDQIHASLLSTPENFVGDVGRGIGGAITGVASKIGLLIWS